VGLGASAVLLMGGGGGGGGGAGVVENIRGWEARSWEEMVMLGGCEMGAGTEDSLEGSW
jgi:hypothetical protein